MVEFVVNWLLWGFVLLVLAFVLDVILTFKNSPETIVQLQKIAAMGTQAQSGKHRSGTHVAYLGSAFMITALVVLWPGTLLV